MKKILSLILTLALAITLTACGNTNSTGQAETSAAPASMPPTVEESENTEENTESNDIEQDTLESETKPTDKPEETGNRILVAYFSRTGENYSVGYIEKGNTHIIADMIAAAADGSPDTPALFSARAGLSSNQAVRFSLQWLLPLHNPFHAPHDGICFFRFIP